MVWEASVLYQKSTWDSCWISNRAHCIQLLLEGHKTVLNCCYCTFYHKKFIQKFTENFSRQFFFLRFHCCFEKWKIFLRLLVNVITIEWKWVKMEGVKKFNWRRLGGCWNTNSQLSVIHWLKRMVQKATGCQPPISDWSLAWKIILQNGNWASSHFQTCLQNIAIHLIYYSLWAWVNTRELVWKWLKQYETSYNSICLQIWFLFFHRQCSFSIDRIVEAPVVMICILPCV